MTKYDELLQLLNDIWAVSNSSILWQRPDLVRRFHEVMSLPDEEASPHLVIDSDEGHTHSSHPSS